MYNAATPGFSFTACRCVCVCVCLRMCCTGIGEIWFVLKLPPGELIFGGGRLSPGEERERESWFGDVRSFLNGRFSLMFRALS